MIRLLFIKGKSSKSSGIFNIYSPSHVILIISLVIGLAISMAVGAYSTKVQNHIADNMIRLHIIANSDSKEDQELKIMVRNAIISEMSQKFKSSNNIDQTRQIALQNLNNIENITKDVLKQNKKDYNVKASLVKSYFPTKQYGDVVLPAGNYNALKVEIGSSKGANWWCVLFPPLCFIDASNGSLPEESKQKLKTSLTEDEYKLITSSSNGSVPVKIKFKSIEMWQESKQKVQVAINSIF